MTRALVATVFAGLFLLAATSCHSSREQPLAVQPAMLKETWAVDWWLPRHEAKLAERDQGDIQLVMIGDSITQGWEEDGAGLWQEYYAGYNALNLGFSGDRTENVLWRLQHGEIDGLDPKVVVLLIGTNNTGHRMDPAPEVALGVQLILDEITQRLPDAEILLLAIFPRGALPTDSERLRNESINLLLEELADGTSVHFLNINDVFLDEAGHLSQDVMPDLLHLNTASYGLWAEAMQPKLLELMERPTGLD